MEVESALMEPDMPILWTDRVWAGDPDGDMILDYEGYRFKVKKDIGCLVVFHYPACTAVRPRVFAALLEYLHTSEFPRQIWEDQASFLTYVEIYFLAERFGIGHLMVNMVKSVEDLSWHILTLREYHCSHCLLSLRDVHRQESQHLTSFLHAIRAVEKRKWSAKIVKAIYDAGDGMKAQLMRLPDFREFVERSSMGRNFARAIGVHRL